MVDKIKFAKASVLITLLIIVTLAVVNKQWVKEAMNKSLEWVGDHPIGGPFVLALVYAALELVFVPSAVLTIGAGYTLKQIHGTTSATLLVGTMASLTGAVLAAVICLYLARFVFQK